MRQGCNCWLPPFGPTKNDAVLLKGAVASLVALNEFQIGGADATSFERMMADLAEWFVNAPETSWRQQLWSVEAVDHTQHYQL